MPLICVSVFVPVLSCTAVALWYGVQVLRLVGGDPMWKRDPDETPAGLAVGGCCLSIQLCDPGATQFKGHDPAVIKEASDTFPTFSLWDKSSKCQKLRSQRHVRPSLFGAGLSASTLQS